METLLGSLEGPVRMETVNMQWNQLNSAATAKSHTHTHTQSKETKWIYGRPKLSDFTERLGFHFSLSCIGEGNGNPLFLPGESQGWWSLVGCHLWGCTESDTTEVT